MELHQQGIYLLNYLISLFINKYFIFLFSKVILVILIIVCDFDLELQILKQLLLESKFQTNNYSLRIRERQRPKSLAYCTH